MPPRTLFPVRPFDPIPPQLVEAAKLIFAPRGEHDSLKVVRLDLHRLRSVRIELPPDQVGEVQRPAPAWVPASHDITRAGRWNNESQ